MTAEGPSLAVSTVVCVAVELSAEGVSVDPELIPLFELLDLDCCQTEETCSDYCC